MVAPFFNANDAEAKLHIMRLSIAVSLAVTWVVIAARSPFHWWAGLTLLVLLFNTVYSIAVFISPKLSEPVLPYVHWIDLGFYSALMVLSYSNPYLFLLGILFAVLVGSATGGIQSGLKLTATSVAIGAAIIAAMVLLERTLVVSDVIALTLLPTGFGVIVSYWTDRSNKIERRLLFLKQITQLANPRFGVDQTVEMILQRLQSFYDAQSCVLVMSEADSGKDFLHRINHHAPSTVRNRLIPKDLARVFLSLPDHHACIWRRDGREANSSCSATVYDIDGRKVPAEGRSVNEQLISTLDARSFISVPIASYAKSNGRLYIINPEIRVSWHDIAFINQVLEHVMRITENLRLVDRLATEAAEHERQKIARDIHDSIVQPYLGLQIGLSAVKTKMEKGLDTSKDIGRLIEVTGAEIADLRMYMGGLKGSKALESNFVQAVKRLASKFEEASGIVVELKADENLAIHDRLAAEAFQLIAEGLSNIRRHTRATRALIHLKCIADEFTILIRNDTDKAEAQSPFWPQSISERTASLGGRVSVRHGEAGATALDISIPL